MKIKHKINYHPSIKIKLNTRRKCEFFLFLKGYQMGKVIDAYQDVRIPEMRQIMIARDLDLGCVQIFRLVGQRLPVEVLRHRRGDPNPGGIFYPYSGALKEGRGKNQLIIQLN